MTSNLGDGTFKCRKLLNFIPKGTESITGDEIEFTIKASQITHEEWCGLLGQEVYSPQGHIIGRTLEHFAESEFSIEQMVEYIEDPENWEHVAEQSRNALLYKLDDYRSLICFQMMD